MSSSRALCRLPSVKKEKKHDFYFFFRPIFYITIIRLCFCDNQNNQGLGKDSRSASAFDFD